MAKFNVAVVGCGGMARKWVEGALRRDDCEIVAFVDINAENAERYRNEFGVGQTFTDVRTAIGATGTNLVFDVTIPESHFTVVTTALEMGCDVFGEKPMAHSIDAARRVIETVERTGRTYSVMQNRRYIKNIRALGEAVTSGVIGEPGFICADFFIGAHFGGFREAMDSPLILDMAIHTFDQARFITGKDPVAVYCHEFNPKGSWYKGNASAVCIFEYADGSVFNYRGSWSAEGHPTSWEAEWRIVGSKGTAMWDGKNAPYCEVVIPPQERVFLNSYNRVEAETTWTGREYHDGCFDEMFAALIEGRPAETDCRDNIKSVAMVYGAIESARTGKKVILG
ncbi:Gfo/Idh/MocA family protein [Paenibacillus alkalitolerans]|uniref:Gfo/Idh/MocA family protein n=1 Tax=Paenibacillus alkalitolerans TaxID=2799335 RepID=UPI0018F64A04|nr:Gfo/Idh/MocA family oxidoreductase [Paenibacillus alkalitolerans]